MLIDPNSKDDVIKYLSIVCHIIDKDTGEDYVKTMVIESWDTHLKKGRYLLHNSDGNPLYDETKDKMVTLPFRFKYKNIQTQFYIPKDLAYFYLGQIAERDYNGIRLGYPKRDMDIIVS